MSKTDRSCTVGPDDLSPAERAQARKTPVRIRDDRPQVGQAVGGGLIETMLGMGLIDPENPANKIMVKQIGNQMTFTKPGDNLSQKMRELDVYDYAARTALRGGKIQQDPAMLERFQEVGFGTRDLETLENLAASVRTGKLDPKRSLSNTPSCTAPLRRRARWGMVCGCGNWTPHFTITPPITLA